MAFPLSAILNDKDEPPRKSQCNFQQRLCEASEAESPLTPNTPPLNTTRAENYIQEPYINRPQEKSALHLRRTHHGKITQTERQSAISAETRMVANTFTDPSPSFPPLTYPDTNLQLTPYRQQRLTQGPYVHGGPPSDREPAQVGQSSLVGEPLLLQPKFQTWLSTPAGVFSSTSVEQPFSVAHSVSGTHSSRYPVTRPSVVLPSVQYSTLYSAVSFPLPHASCVASPKPLTAPRPPFHIYQHLLYHPELVHCLASHLSPSTLISLYGMSRPFRTLADSRFTTMILSNARAHAPESSRVFSFKAYSHLCITDPAANPNPETSSPNKNVVRDVPSFRWLRMVYHREEVVDGIIESLAKEGHRLPRRASLTIKKMWFTMEMPDNARRVGYMHNEECWTDVDLFLATMFLIKLDMHFGDPLEGDGESGIRELCMAQRELTTLGRVLRREELKNIKDLAVMMAKWKYVPQGRWRGRNVLGISSGEVGWLDREGLKGGRQGAKKLMRVDELIMREGIRRGLDLNEKYLDMMLWGYVNEVTGEDIWQGDKVEEPWVTDDENDAEEGDKEDEEKVEEEEEGVDGTNILTQMN